MFNTRLVLRHFFDGTLVHAAIYRLDWGNGYTVDVGLFALCDNWIPFNAVPSDPLTCLGCVQRSLVAFDAVANFNRIEAFNVPLH